MVADSFASRSAAPVALDLSGFSVASLPGLAETPHEIEDRFTQVRALLQAGECIAALSRVSALHHEPSLRSPGELRALQRGLEGSAKIALGAADSGEADLLQALADAKSTRRLVSPLGVSLLNNLSVLSFQFHHRATAAENQLQQAISFIPDRVVDRFNQRPICFRNLGIVQDSRGLPNEAAKSLRHALDENTRGPMATLELLDILATNRERSNDPLAVEALRVAAFSMMERERENFPEAFIAAAHELSLLLLRNGELQRLGQIVEGQVNVMGPTLSPASRWRLTPAALLLALHHADGARWAKAYSMIDWALDLEKVSPPDTDSPLDFLRNVATHYRKEGLHRQASIAKEVYRVALAKRSKNE